MPRYLILVLAFVFNMASYALVENDSIRSEKWVGARRYEYLTVKNNSGIIIYVSERWEMRMGESKDVTSIQLKKETKGRKKSYFKCTYFNSFNGLPLNSTIIQFSKQGTVQIKTTYDELGKKKNRTRIFAPAGSKSIQKKTAY